MSVPLRWEEPLPQPIAPVPTGPSLRRRRKSHRQHLWKSILGTLLIASVCALAVVGGASVMTAMKGPAALSLSSPAGGGGQAVLGSASAERHLGFVTIGGDVISRSDKPLASVEAIVELLDGQGRTLQMESALLPFDPLPARQSSPFSVEMNDNARAVSYRVRFRTLGGVALN